MSKAKATPTMHKTNLKVESWNVSPWKEHYNQFAELSLMARDFMSILIITVISESSFSIGKNFLLRIDYVFYPRIWKLRCVLKVGYMDLKVI